MPRSLPMCFKPVAELKMTPTISLVASNQNERSGEFFMAHTAAVVVKLVLNFTSALMRRIWSNSAAMQCD